MPDEGRPVVAPRGSSPAAASDPDRDEERSVVGQLRPGDAERQVVDGVLQHPRPGQRDGGGGDDGGQAFQELAPIGERVFEQPPEG